MHPDLAQPRLQASMQFETGHGSILTTLIDDEDLDCDDRDVLPELTIKVFRKWRENLRCAKCSDSQYFK